MENNNGENVVAPLPEGFFLPPVWPFCPTSSLPPLKVPPQGTFSLFFSLFTTIPDTLIWMIVGVLAYGFQYYQFMYTDSYQHLKIKGGLGRRFIIHGLPVIVLCLTILYFYQVKRIRRNCLIALHQVNPNGVGCKMISAVVVGVVGSLYIWLGESNFHYVFLKLAFLFFLISIMLTLRPSTDFNLINGFLISMITHGFRITFAPAPGTAPPKSLAIPFVVLLISALTNYVRLRCEEKCVEADKYQKEREDEAKAAADTAAAEAVLRNGELVRAQEAREAAARGARRAGDEARDRLNEALTARRWR